MAASRKAKADRVGIFILTELTKFLLNSPNFCIYLEIETRRQEGCELETTCESFLRRASRRRRRVG